MTLVDFTRSWLGWRELRALQTDLLGAYQRWREQHGEACQFRFAGQRHILLYQPAAIEHVLKTSTTHFVRSRRLVRVLRQLVGDSLTAAEGSAWLARRRLLAPPFQRQHIQGYADILRQTVESAFPARLETFDALPRMADLTLRLFCAAVLDLRLPAASLGDDLQTLGRVAMVELFLPAPLPDWLPLPIVRRKRIAIARLRAFVEALLQTPQKRDNHLLARLREVGLTSWQLRDELLNLMLAGHETTAAGLSWALSILAARPDLAERVAADPTLEQAERFVRETLRLYPPAPAVFLREALEDVEVAGWPVPRHSLVHLPACAVHRNPDYFPDPLRFDPDRFAPEAARGRPDFAYFPFGGGARVCLGQSFAMLEMALVVAHLARHFRLSTPVRHIQAEVRFSLWPRGPLPIRIEPI